MTVLNTKGLTCSYIPCSYGIDRTVTTGLLFIIICSIRDNLKLNKTNSNIIIITRELLVGHIASWK